LPPEITNPKVSIFDNIQDGIRGADAIMMLRIQYERIIHGSFTPDMAREFVDNFRIDHDKLILAKPDVIVMHPGPMNRDVEITSALADDLKYSVIREQVESGVAVRMAVLDLLLGGTWLV
jgi:aspartate carbamoyltransferase catalytic subunit